MTRAQNEKEAKMGTRRQETKYDKTNLSLSDLPRLWQFLAGNGVDHLAPWQGRHSQYEADDPLRQRQRSHREPFSTILNDADLGDKGGDPDDAEDTIPQQAFEHVTLAVHLPGVDLVEQRHHDKGVEDQGEVLGWRGEELGMEAGLDAEDLVTVIEDGEQDDHLVDGMTENVLDHRARD